MNNYRIFLSFKDGSENFYETQSIYSFKEIVEQIKSKDKNLELESVLVKKI